MSARLRVTRPWLSPSLKKRNSVPLEPARASATEGLPPHRSTASTEPSALMRPAASGEGAGAAFAATTRRTGATLRGRTGRTPAPPTAATADADAPAARAASGTFLRLSTSRRKAAICSSCNRSCASSPLTRPVNWSSATRKVVNVSDIAASVADAAVEAPLLSATAAPANASPAKATGLMAATFVCTGSRSAGTSTLLVAAVGSSGETPAGCRFIASQAAVASRPTESVAATSGNRLLRVRASGSSEVPAARGRLRS